MLKSRKEMFINLAEPGGEEDVTASSKKLEVPIKQAGAAMLCSIFKIFAEPYAKPKIPYV